MLAHHEHALEVERHDALPGLHIEFPCRFVALGHPDIVVQDVHPAVASDCGVDDGTTVILAGHIGLERARLRPFQECASVLRPGADLVDEQAGRPLLGKTHRDGTPVTDRRAWLLPRSDDHRDLALQTTSHASSPSAYLIKR